MSQFSKEEKERIIIESYKNNSITVTKLQKQLKISPSTIYKILKENNISYKGHCLPENVQKQICELYQSGKSIKSIMNELGLGRSSVLKYLKKYKINVINAGNFKRKYSLDENIFEEIDSFEKAQFLGLLYSDGSMSKYNKNISLRLREDDIDFLERWRSEFLKTEKPILFSCREKMTSPSNGKEYSTPYKMAILDITSHKVYNDLLKIGLMPNKTKENLKMPDLKEELKPAFILGLFEGDGCVSFCQKSRYFSIACQSNMAHDIHEYFQSIGIFSRIYDRKSVFIVQISRWDDLKKLYNLLYKNANIFLFRKKEKFSRILESRIS